MFIAENWKEYEVIATGDGEKLERWGDYTLIRPDPQIIWKMLPEPGTGRKGFSFSPQETKLFFS